MRVRASALILVVTSALACQSEPPREYLLRSPDGSIEARIAFANRFGEADFPDAVAPYLTVVHEGRVILAPSPLGIETNRGSFRDDLVVVSDSSRAVDENYTTLVGKRRVRAVRGNERTLRLRAPSGDEVELVLRAHDDGIAYRYRVLGSGTVTVTAEHSGFSIPLGRRGWLAPYDLAGILAGNYEHAPVEQDVGQPVSLSTGFAYPALFELDGGDHALVTESDASAAYCVTRLAEAPVDGTYRVRLPDDVDGLGVGAVNPTSTLPLETPWRVVMIGDLPTLVESTLVDDLARPTTMTDTSWIEPGRSAWSWPTQGTGDLALQTAYASFAGSMGWEYVLVDSYWDAWPSVATAVPTLVQTAGAGGVRVALWYNSGGAHSPAPDTPRDKMLDPTVRRAEMAMLESWGVAGIKVDFFQSDKQDRIAQYIGILEDAAAHHLVVNFHGATLPRGWFRTYPNLLTVEAVRGAEYYETGAALVPTPALLVLDVFMRTVVGSTDFTPMLLDSARATGGVGYGASLATTVAFESGLVHFADRADGSTTSGYGPVFTASPAVRDALVRVPVTWDETEFVDGTPRTHAVLARRNGTEWWIAGLDGDPGSRDFVVPASALGGGRYACRVITGGPDGATFTATDVTLDATNPLAVTTIAGDGFLATCAPSP